MTPEERDYVVEVLKDVPGLASAPPDVLDTMATYFQIRKLGPGAWVCQEGNPADALFIMGDGTAEVIKASKSGKRFGVATLTPGVLFGHVAVVTGGRRTAGIRASSDVTLLQLSASMVTKLVTDSPMTMASPFRQALIIALSRQLSSAAATTMQLAKDAGISEENPYEEGTVTTDVNNLPEDTEERLAIAQSLLS